ncbi:uncharacterized protein LOC118267552 [Spodoptera frugiperda]|uniref:Uncharacterized protein LOC118267552 n=1 Tax=Spodoptera frugiperda TaxID=7108 RepID=A0A9R0D285_SPOFR|nr:uncharacterized protein LOC118267552 [Spodoptera frugiperda]
MVFELPRYNKCCCCIPLKIGVLLIGYFSIFMSCMTLATISWTIFTVSKFVDNHQNQPNPEHPPSEIKKVALGLYLTFAYYLLVFLVNLAINIVLIIGAHREKPNYLRFYFRATLLMFCLSIALVIVTFVFMGFIATLPILKWSLTLLVVMIIVRSYYLVLEDREKPPVYELQPYVPVQQAPLMA